MKSVGRSTAWLALMLIGVVASGHDSPEHRIEALTALIEAEGPHPAVLVRRAEERYALGDVGGARDDFQAAIDLGANDAATRLGLARVNLALGDHDATVAAVEAALSSPGSTRLSGSLHAVAAQSHDRAGRLEEAKRAWDAALAAGSPQADWVLGYARLLTRVGEPSAATTLIESHRAAGGGASLIQVWVEALIAEGRLAEARREIEARLARSRLRARWLVLRGRVALAEGHHSIAARDARSALNELSALSDPSRPNAVLDALRDEARRLVQVALQVRHNDHEETAKEL